MGGDAFPRLCLGFPRPSPSFLLPRLPVCLSHLPCLSLFLHHSFSLSFTFLYFCFFCVSLPSPTHPRFLSLSLFVPHVLPFPTFSSPRFSTSSSSALETHRGYLQRLLPVPGTDRMRGGAGWVCNSGEAGPGPRKPGPQLCR